ncbi:GMC oxidoreductase-domain-containing protein, partial [Mycena crocata]
GNVMRIGMIVLSPLSRGSVINSTNPFDPSAIDVGYLQSDIDCFIARQAIKKVQSSVKAPAWRDYILFPNVDLKNSSLTSMYGTGTAAMSAKNARYGVVDPDLLVKGAVGLRVIDASVFLFVPSGHTQAATYAFAERGADLVKAAWKRFGIMRTCGSPFNTAFLVIHGNNSV